MPIYRLWAIQLFEKRPSLRVRRRIIGPVQINFLVASNCSWLSIFRNPSLGEFCEELQEEIVAEENREHDEEVIRHVHLAGEGPVIVEDEARREIGDDAHGCRQKPVYLDEERAHPPLLEDLVSTIQPKKATGG